MPATPEGFTTRTQALRAELAAQGSRVQTLVESAFASVFALDTAKARQAMTLDDAIDQADVAIEQRSVGVLTDATREGAAIDARQLRELLTIVKANNELERIADVGVDLCELVPALAALNTPIPETFRVMTNSVVGIVRDVNQAMEKNDPRLAKLVLQSQHAVTSFKQVLLREAEQKLARGLIAPEFAFQLHEMATMCEIIADHCTNIAEQVIYLTTGAIVRHMESSWVEVGRPGESQSGS